MIKGLLLKSCLYYCPYTEVPTEIIMFIQLKPFLSLFCQKNSTDKASILYFVPAQFSHLTFPNAFFNAKIYIPVKNMKGSTGKIKQEKKHIYWLASM